jgi:tetratricopeptide (TPR) repeat protein
MDNQPPQPPLPYFRIFLCGAFRVEKRVGESYVVLQAAEWGGSNYPRLLLKALLCCPGRQARREALSELLWPEVDFEQANANLNTATSKLRLLLRPAEGQDSLLFTEDDATLYRPAGQPFLWVDAEEGVALFKEVERRGRTSPEALPLLEQASSYFSQGSVLQEEEGQWAAFLSRRSALLVIAALPKGLLGLLQQQKAAFIEEEFLPACAASITACWYLLNGREFASVERALARYLPFLITWAQQPSSYQKRAAYLAAQACLLLGFIELHRLHFQQRIVYCREAVRHGREAGNHPLLVKALTQLGNAYYAQGMDTKMLQVYQEAKHLCTEDVPCSLDKRFS